ncbi:DUF2934 domain-containing protein [Methylocaldum sp. 14B]|uniref:DUF2934 domain-containing protein n=1 Tax=Methylocaldum sp. 14B TaxID=1912213 RepID=UPI00098A8218|nr:DUF2934 domain-containing protein [Methylocaldum sp. 14B]
MAKKDEKPITEQTGQPPVEKGQAKPGEVPEKEKESDASAARHQWIAEAAYHKARARGFEPGYEESDWLETEREYEQAHPSKEEG